MRFKAFIVFILLSASVAMAELLPHYRSTYNLDIGYIYTENTDSATAAEHMDSRDSLTLGALIETYPLPQRFHLELNLKTNRDFYLDTGHAWKDILLTRFIATGTVHNIELPSLPAQNPDSNHRYLDQTEDPFYSLNNGLYDLKLRLKSPGYAFHLFGRYLAYKQKGTLEERFLTGYHTTTMDIHSIKRDLKRETETYTTGINGHLGPIEGEYSYTYKTFNPSGTTVLRDYYPKILSREEGMYYHNLYPKLKAFTHTLKVHTSYTGRIVATATFMATRQENTHSDVKRDNLYLGTGLRYLPAHWLTFTLQGIYQKQKEDSPSSVTIENYTYTVRQPPDTELSTIKTRLRLRPVRSLTFLLGYSFKNKNLSSVSEWPVLRGDGQYQQWSIGVMNPISQKFKLMGRYTHEENEPIYNIEPHRADSLSVSGQTLFSGPINAMLYYHWRQTYRKDLSYYNPLKKTLNLITNERKANSQQAMIVLPLSVTEDLSLSPSFSYTRQWLKGPLVFMDTASAEQLIYDAQNYTEEALTYGIACHAKINDLLSSSISASYTTSHGTVDLNQEVSDMEGFFEHSYRMTELQGEISIKTLNAIYIRPSLRYILYKDRTGLLTSGDTYQINLSVSAHF